MAVRYLGEDIPGTAPRDELVYHYTNSTGLMGILKSQALYASHAQYLNDRSEGAHGLTITLQAMRSVVPASEMTPVLDQFLGWLARPPSGYVLSASREPDLLNQWQHYGAHGFAIGLDRRVPLRVRGMAAEWPSLSWRDVSYPVGAPPELASAFKQEMGLSAEAGNSLTSVLTEDSTRGRAIRDAVSPRIYYFKNPAFSAEQESRVYVNSRADAACQVRQDAQGGLLRYVELSAGNNFLPIREIICGPGLPADQFKVATSVKRLLTLNNLDQDTVTVSRSLVPYIA